VLIFNPSIGETGSRKQQSENWSKHGASSAAHGSGPPFTQQRMLLQEAMQ
jgi:hypothetical protein